MTTAEELRALVAERVMGYTMYGPEKMQLWNIGDGHPRLVHGLEGFRPDESWADAGRVIERMGELGYYMFMDYDPDGTAYVAFHQSRFLGVDILDTTHSWPIKKAISLAALRALGVEVE